MGRVSQRLGRRAGLSAGYLTGALGSVGVVVAASIGNIVLLFGSLLVYGAGVATNLQARYAGADLAAPSRRGRAVSIVLVATAVGAIIGPNLVERHGHSGREIGVPASRWAVHARCYRVRRRPGSCCGCCCARIRCCWPAALPPPGRRRAGKPRRAAIRIDWPAGSAPESARTWSWALASGAGIMILTQLIMVAIMTMTPIHIEHHGHSIDVTGIVIGAHVAGMFLPSPFSGWLVDRFGYLTDRCRCGHHLARCGPARRVGAGRFGGDAGTGPGAARRWDGTWGWSAAPPW